jgi:hypothetical protein
VKWRDLKCLILKFLCYFFNSLLFWLCLV